LGHDNKRATHWDEPRGLVTGRDLWRDIGFG
jgi:hypothetical protein